MSAWLQRWQTGAKGGLKKWSAAVSEAGETVPGYVLLGILRLSVVFFWDVPLHLWAQLSPWLNKTLLRAALPWHPWLTLAYVVLAPLAKLTGLLTAASWLSGAALSVCPAALRAAFVWVPTALLGQLVDGAVLAWWLLLWRLPYVFVLHRMYRVLTADGDRLGHYGHILFPLQNVVAYLQQDPVAESLQRVRSWLKRDCGLWPAVSSAPLTASSPPHPDPSIAKQEPLPSWQVLGRESAAPKHPQQAQERTPLEQLDAMVGLQRAKAEVRAVMAQHILNKRRKELGQAEQRVHMHMVFSGRPGTGKTTVARLYAAAMRQEGLLAKGHLVEATRADLIAGYVGHTALKMRAVCESALDGVLFIDEAYSLANRADQHDFGAEAIEELLTFMENHRQRLTVIAAGYQEKMEGFVQSNPGLASRFTSYVTFEDYTDEELAVILTRTLQEKGFRANPGAVRRVVSEKLPPRTDDTFANARSVRNLLERAILAQSQRLLAWEAVVGRRLSLVQVETLLTEDFDLLAQ